MKNLYQTLGVEPSASPDELKKAYRKLAMQYHPDRNQGDAESEAKFKEINEAYEILSDPVKKQQWEASSSQNQQRNPFRGGGAGFPFGGGMHTHNLDDILRAFHGGFGGFSPNFGAGFAANNPVTNVQLNVSILDAFLGKDVPIEFSANGSHHSLVVTVPRGAEHGHRFRFSGKQENGTSVGELHVILAVHDQHPWSREGSTLIKQEEIPIWTTISGGNHQLTLIDGEQINLTVPLLCKYGAQLRVKSKGMPQAGVPEKRGDLIVQVIPVLPTSLTEEQSTMISSWSAKQ
jgi:curved DNA-binding protein